MINVGSVRWDWQERMVNCECELSRIALGDLLVAKVAEPALSQLLTSVDGVVCGARQQEFVLRFVRARAQHSHEFGRALSHGAHSQRLHGRGGRCGGRSALDALRGIDGR